LEVGCPSAPELFINPLGWDFSGRIFFVGDFALHSIRIIYFVDLGIVIV